jgi:hypothetical protein
MGEIARQRQVTQKCAANAANYVHPKLANISHVHDPDHPLIISDEERANAVLVLQRRDQPALSSHWTSCGATATRSVIVWKSSYGGDLGSAQGVSEYKLTQRAPLLAPIARARLRSSRAPAKSPSLLSSTPRSLRLSAVS